ncbi:MAG: acetoacetate decarboxylase family protein [Proteobacteria bacterium]|nr:acetoacetate decarboxylase family protein [Pseudomonadota bacterium]
MNNLRTSGNPFFDGLVQIYDREYDVLLPIFYYNAASFTGIFTADTEKVKAHLPFPDMKPVEIFPGRALVALTALEYKDTDIDPYNEFSVAVLITYRERNIPVYSLLKQLFQNSLKTYILSLPVTTDRARRGGVELGGYPKFLAEIEFKDTPGERVCVVSTGNHRLLTFYGKKTKTQKGRKIHAKVYTSMQGKAMSANLYMNQKEFSQTLGKGNSGIDIGSGHLVCDILNNIGLSKHPLAYQYVPNYEAILFNPKNIIDI